MDHLFLLYDLLFPTVKSHCFISELFYTEKCHVRSLKIMDKLFYRPMLKESSIPNEFTKSLFPNLETMILLHGKCRGDIE